MDEQRILTPDLIKSLMESAHTLVRTGYDDNLNSHRGLIQKYLDSKSREHLWEEADVWYSDAEQETVRGIITKLKEKCTVFSNFDEEDVNGFFGEREDEIRDEVYSRNNLDVIKELIMYADDTPIRVEMPSNCDCVNSHQPELQGDYRYEEFYFGGMVDSLNLNPARVKKTLAKRGYKAYGHFPNRKNRSGREQVLYEWFYEKLINSCCGANLPTYIGRVNLRELHETGFSLEEVVIPGGNCCGLFSSAHGDESLLEVELRENARLKLRAKDYYDSHFRLDDERSKYECSIRYVYRVDDSFFGERISLVAS